MFSPPGLIVATVSSINSLNHRPPILWQRAMCIIVGWSSGRTCKSNSEWCA